MSKVERQPLASTQKRPERFIIDPIHQMPGLNTQKNGPQAIGKSRGGWNIKIHLLAADARTAITFCLSPGQAHDAPEGRKLLKRLGPPHRPLHLLMDRAYEGNETRQLALDLGFIPVVPPLRTRIEPWEYDREMYNLALARELLNAVPAQASTLHNDDQADVLSNAAPPAFVCTHCGHAMTIVQSWMRGQAIRAPPPS